MNSLHRWLPIWLCLITLSLNAAPSRQPNVVVFVADDMGFADCGVYGSKDISTPHIDSAPLLFNLIKDPGEKTDLAASQPEKARQLQQLWDAWNSNNEPPRWIDVRWNGNGPGEKKAAKKAGGARGKSK